MWLAVIDDSGTIITFINEFSQILMVPKYKCPAENYMYTCPIEPNIAYCTSSNKMEKFGIDNFAPLLRQLRR